MSNSLDSMLRTPACPLSFRGSDDQTTIAIHMAEIFDAAEVARSIARFGYYPWEALVVIPSGANYIVVEGNRRLAAIKGLLDSHLRANFADADIWRAAVEGATRDFPTLIPCVVVSDRKEAAPALGYRHISGIKPWEPQMQARFVASLIDSDGLSYEEVAELTGQTKPWVQDTYSTFKVFEAAESVGVDTEPAAEAYSLLTVAMSTKELRDHVRAKRSIPEGGAAIESPDASRIGELFEWVFGSETSEPVASESREIRALAKVVAKASGLEAIRAGCSLEEARQAVEDDTYDSADIVRRDLVRAEQILRRIALTDIAVTSEIQALVDAVVEQAQRLVNEIESEGT